MSLVTVSKSDIMIACSKALIAVAIARKKYFEAAIQKALTPKSFIPFLKRRQLSRSEAINKVLLWWRGSERKMFPPDWLTGFYSQENTAIELIHSCKISPSNYLYLSIEKANWVFRHLNRK